MNPGIFPVPSYDANVVEETLIVHLGRGLSLERNNVDIELGPA